MRRSVLAILAASAISSALELGRVYHTASGAFSFMLWNLVLGWIPFLAALLATRLARMHRLVTLALGTVWLIFLPNAPYMLTDFVHLPRQQGGAGAWNAGAPVWFDALLLTSFALTGLMLGFASLHLMERLVGPSIGGRSGRGLALVALALSSFGIYLGRVQQWNSWDVVVRPATLLAALSRDVATGGAREHVLLITAALAVPLAATYVLLCLVFERPVRQEP